MSRTTLIVTILLLVVSAAHASTFNQRSYVADNGIDVLSRGVANKELGRDLFGSPWATAVVGNVDIYDRFPYVEARYYQIVSDPEWGRLLMGEVGRGLIAFDGAASAFGALNAPRGLATDEFGRLYLADTGNDRVLVFRTSGEFERIELEPLYAIDGLSRPYDVAFSDGGTPFDRGDDRLYVANTGANEVRRYDATDTGARFTDAIGELGSGDSRFAGPIAIAVGRDNGSGTSRIYVSDAHNQRIVELRDTGRSLAWAGGVRHALGPVTALDSDHWGNVYASAPHTGRVAKFSASLFPVAILSDGIERPRAFHVVFANVTDHRSGTRSRAGQGGGVLVEEWDGDTGLRLMDLGVEAKDAAALPGNAVGVTLTDHARVVAELIDPSTGDIVARHETDVLGAGRHAIRFEEEDFMESWSRGEYRVALRATSTYDGHPGAETTLTIRLDSAGSPSLPRNLTLLGNTPNPFNPSTSIRFQVPAGPQREYELRVYDVRGRLVRELAGGRVGPGPHSVEWDGRNDNGASVSSGIYLYRVRVGTENRTGKMVLVK